MLINQFIKIWRNIIFSLSIVIFIIIFLIEGKFPFSSFVSGLGYLGISIITSFFIILFIVLIKTRDKEIKEEK